MLNKILIASLLAVPSLVDDSYKPVPVNPREVYCLYEALWHEARGESHNGVLAVAEVIRNRVYSGKFGNSYCSVIRQHKQFSYVHQRRAKKQPLYPLPSSNVERELAESLKIVARDTVEGYTASTLPKDAMWYHTKKVKPKWRKNLNQEKVIDNHIFYSEK